MRIDKLRIINYKLFRDVTVHAHEDYNIFVGDNDSGKSTILEALQIVLSGKLNSYSFERQVKPSMFNQITRETYIKSVMIKDEKASPALPKIIIEVYFSSQEGANATILGTNNTLGENSLGMSMELSFNPDYSKEYKKMLGENEIYDIPIELYSIKWRYFSGDVVYFRTCPFRLSVIDTTRKDYSSTLNRFIYNNISCNLTDDEEMDLSIAYRKIKKDFLENENVVMLNERIKDGAVLSGRNIRFGIKEDELDAWKNEVCIDIDEIPFENIGFGSQNVIKMELAIEENAEETNILLFEEPENNLSFTNMSKLIYKVSTDTSKQVFISTHSSHIANKLGLDKISILHNGKAEQLNKIDPSTMNFFKKLPGYDTLRLLLSEKCILVEGPTDELIIERAYIDTYGKLPIQDGVDVISVGSLAFLRYCEIANLIKKPLIIVTDNDGDIEKKINEKYKQIIEDSDGLVKIFFDENEELNTLENSVLKANITTTEDFQNFKEIISIKNSLINRDKEGILSFMLSNKTEWALRVFDSEGQIKYPEHIQNAIEK